MRAGADVRSFTLLGPFALVLLLALSPVQRAAEPAPVQCSNGEDRVGNDCIKLPQLIGKRKKPYYPADAAYREIEGTAKVQYRITETGSIDDVTVVSCTRPGLGFEEAAVASVKKWRYRPGTKNGQPTSILATVDVQFKRHH